MRNSLMALALSFVLVGCATQKTTQTTITVPPTYSQNIPIPTVEPVRTEEVNWLLLNREKATKFIQSTPDDFLLYTIDDNGMKSLIGNIQELRRYILSQQAKIDYLIGVLDARKEKPNGPLPDAGRTP